MSFDVVKNLAKVTLAAGYDASATSISLLSGHGAKLPAPPFNATWWNASNYGDPADDPNVEIVRVTDVTGDTLEVIRAQEGTTATVKNSGGKTYRLVAGFTALSYQNITAYLLAVLSVADVDPTEDPGIPFALKLNRAQGTLWFWALDDGIWYKLL